MDIGNIYTVRPRFTGMFGGKGSCPAYELTIKTYTGYTGASCSYLGFNLRSIYQVHWKTGYPSYGVYLLFHWVRYEKTHRDPSLECPELHFITIVTMVTLRNHIHIHPQVHNNCLQYTLSTRVHWSSHHWFWTQHDFYRTLGKWLCSTCTP